MTVAKLFMSGGSQAVRLPREFRFDGSEVEIFRRGDEVVLRERPANLSVLLDIIDDMPADMLIDLQDGPPQEREGL
ncbi:MULTISPECIES: type II toxin-antitoxin system VapB family antitoxin [Methylobacterium]|jgi:antitoxin VapB|uniref:Virulence factor n=2 Tax=Methylobacterium TaxID=407 RepID=A0A0C6FMI1_9HYPH|nr:MULTISPECIES: type II toxin-antitoxin system VapB family antitoxin [Methylobacterium]MBZ6413678.1 type II toxin-antitoxin system VapB family antitoxin [Methylobacterium sp.]MBK3395265.1 AbrB/MazE/SpoVT family DNA-binding domain-containing protein [Methylobacterium ajmalii]MBK3409857.1 AbrB/MazE/SpoVT family DNA-binding domain-containing protein [Methylobacterium ajmalii]MBK3426550.1 AbrB/MazE/SpoVT family DNA-binding domain-containing protein [Methylobacterium ajmalii]SFF41231.1 antitoxin V